MNFAFSDEQDALRSSVREFLAARYPVERVAQIADAGGFDPAEWRAIGELGWTSISIPEADGGAGLTFVEEAIVLEEAGRSLYPGPLLSTLGLAHPALAGDDLARVASGAAAATLAWAEEDGAFPDHGSRTRAERDGDGWRVNGRKRVVTDVEASEILVVVTDAGAVVVDRDAEGVSFEPARAVDGTRRLADVTLRDAPGRGEGLAPAVVRTHGCAAIAVEAVGVAQAALDLSSAHAAQREQFGRPIGSFQAVSHQLADSLMDLESARSLAYWAAWCVAEGDPEAEIAGATAKAFATEAAVSVCERAIQVHGGIGFTWESPLHRYYKRALGLEALLGRPREQRAAVAASLLARGEGATRAAG